MRVGASPGGQTEYSSADPWLPNAQRMVLSQPQKIIITFGLAQQASQQIVTRGTEKGPRELFYRNPSKMTKRYETAKRQENIPHNMTHQ